MKRIYREYVPRLKEWGLGLVAPPSANLDLAKYS
jgi:hypothetical protein